MKINQLLNLKHMDLSCSFKNKDDVLHYLADMVSSTNHIKDKKVFYQDLISREQEASTNMDIGVAIPHSHSDVVDQSTVAIIKLNEAIDWDEEGEKVKYVFMLAASKNDREVTHLELIAKIAELLLEDEFMKFLEDNRDAKKLKDKMIEMIGGSL